MTFALPFGSEHGLHTTFPEESITLNDSAVPYATCHDKVDDCPGAIVVGLAVTVRLNGTETVVVCGPALPPGPVAVIEYVVVPGTGTTADPYVGKAAEAPSSLAVTGGVIVTDVALLVAQVSVVV